MPTPSLLIVPARFKSGKLYSQVPTSGTGDFTVTRATTATRVNASGLIESVASGIPRLDYFASGGTVGCPALLVEPAATNVAPNANLMNVLDTPTVSGGVTLTTGSTDFLAPDGTSASINKYVGGTASGSTQNTRYAATALQATVSGAHTFSIFVKRGATNPLDFCAISIGLFTAASGTPTSYFNLASGTAITAGASIQNYGNGWYRLISAPYTLASTDLSGTVTFNLASTSGSVSFAASGALNLTAYTWGAQLETGSVATSYIPTTTASVTRNADVISVSGAVSGSIGQTEGTLYAEVDLTSKTYGNIKGILHAGFDSNNYCEIGLDTNGTILARVVVSGNFLGSSVSSSVSSGICKVALAYNQSSLAVALNGTILSSQSTSAFSFASSLNKVELGTRIQGGAGRCMNDRIRAAALYTTRLTDTQLATLTTL